MDYLTGRCITRGGWSLGHACGVPPHDDDTLDWSWDQLTGGVRAELPDDQVDLVVLFAGVADAAVEAHAAQLRELLG